MKPLPFVAGMLLGALGLSIISSSVSAVTNHIVISEVQADGSTANDEFVELYNPTDVDVDLDGWRLRRKTQTGTEATLVNTISGVIPAHGYFLIVRPATYDGPVAPDQTYSATTSSFTKDATILLYQDGTVLVDKVGMGTATDTEVAAATAPTTDGSIERKASPTSTSESMDVLGVDELEGNGEDTDDNSADFVSKSLATPQNSQSAIEPVQVPTQTPTQEPTPTPSIPTDPTPTEMLSPTPTTETSPTPTTEPTPTITVTPVPTSTPLPTPSVTPTTVPTITVTPQISPTHTVVPTPTGIVPTQFPTPSPTKKPYPFPSIPRFPRTVCQISWKAISTRFFLIQFPVVSCSTTF